MNDEDVARDFTRGILAGIAKLAALDAMPPNEAADCIFDGIRKAVERADFELVAMLIRLMARYDRDLAEQVRNKLTGMIKKELARRATLN